MNTTDRSAATIRYLPASGRALVAFWAAIAGATTVTASILAWLGPVESQRATSPSYPPAPQISAPRHAAATVANAPSVSGEVPVPAFAPLVTQGARIAFIVDGFGFSEELSNRALQELPPQIGLSISPYAPNIPALIQRAHAAGHEVYLSLPMQGASTDALNAGPRALGYRNTPAADLDNLRWSIGRAPGIVGVLAADPGRIPSALSSAPAYAATPDFLAIARAIAARHLLLVTDPGQTDRKVQGMDEVSVLDMDQNRAGMHEQCAALAEQARGALPLLVVTDTLTPVGLSYLSAWAQSLGDEGIALVPPSALRDRDAARASNVSSSR